ncbi:hypothetical protein LSH36_808g00122 [Paralvinella palmiformis]|uniref:Fucosyltransferase n=1 Tax=Paralvinella palmiformis TaxID=53620 RepID=A0AAD9J1C6_9ANNE|nr:hypothetical protein LSH36_808g00122 [Paralvinella palmiformis]
MGASKDDYKKVAPPGSFIHVDDFTSPQQLAKYLDYLISNNTAYLEYFAWKGTGTFIDTKFWCRMCSLLHGAGHHVTWYDDIEPLARRSADDIRRSFERRVGKARWLRPYGDRKSRPFSALTVVIIIIDDLLTVTWFSDVIAGVGDLRRHC